MSDVAGEKLRILVLGAAYGALPAAKMLFAGHDVCFVCRSHEAQLINADGFQVRMPVKQYGEIELDSRKLPGRATAKTPSDVNSIEYDLVFLAMQEPQYSAPQLRTLLQKIAASRVPCISVMNMPPPPYLKRITGLWTDDLVPAFTEVDVWSGFDPARLTLCSPDPQAVRPQGEEANVLQVTLATNFKVAKFGTSEIDSNLIRLQSGFEAARFKVADVDVAIPVKFNVFDSVFVPLAKWPMLLAGNYRCIMGDATRTIAEAIHADIEESQSVYDFVRDICLRLGARVEDLVPFEKYAAASVSLVRPSSSARALYAGAHAIERADKLVQLIGRTLRMRHPIVDTTVALVDRKLKANREQVAV